MQKNGQYGYVLAYNNKYFKFHLAGEYGLYLEVIHLVPHAMLVNNFNPFLLLLCFFYILPMHLAA